MKQEREVPDDPFGPRRGATPIAARGIGNPKQGNSSAPPRNNSTMRSSREHYNDDSYFSPDFSRRNTRPTGHEWQPPARSTPYGRASEQFPVGPNTQEQQRTSNLRFHRPLPLAENIPVAEKYERWLDWKEGFDVALTVCEGNPSEQQKVGLLFTSVGAETQRTIRILGLPPTHAGGWSNGNEYESLSRGLNNYFRGMVDEAVDYARFHDAKQGLSEDIHRYTMRLRELAAGINVAPSSFGFRHQLLKGMRNRELAAEATDDNIPLGELIPIAARKEQREASEAKQKPEEAWRAFDPKRAEVAAVAESKRFYTSTKRKLPREREDDQPAGKSKQCRYCGGHQHTNKKSCPAYGKSCRDCGKPNHFAKVCEAKKKGAKVNAVGSEEGETETQVRKENFLYT